MSVRLSSLVWQQSKSKNAARLVALAIADFADDAGRAYPAISTLARKAALSMRATQNAIRQLVSLGELMVRLNAGPSNANLYLLIIGQSSEEQMSFSPPPANTAPANIAPRRIEREGVQILREGGADSADKPSVQPSGTVNGAPRSKSASPTQTLEQFVSSLRINPGYAGIDIDRELSRMDAWLETPKGRGRKKTHRFVLNWLNKAEPTLTGPSKAKPPPVKDPARWRAFLQAHGRTYEPFQCALQHAKLAFAEWEAKNP